MVQEPGKHREGFALPTAAIAALHAARAALARPRRLFAALGGHATRVQAAVVRLLRCHRPTAMWLPCADRPEPRPRLMSQKHAHWWTARCQTQVEVPGTRARRQDSPSSRESIVQDQPSAMITVRLRLQRRRALQTAVARGCMTRAATGERDTASDESAREISRLTF